MNSFIAMTGRIILVFAQRFTAAVCLAGLAIGSAQAQSHYKVKLGIDYKGGLYTVSSGMVAGGDRVELPVQPSGVIKVFARAIGLPGVSGQALLDLQVYESRGGSPAQLSALTMPVYLATENTADVDSKQGKLKITAYVEDSAAPVATAAPSSAPIQNLPTPAFASPNQSVPVSSPQPRKPVPQISVPAGVRPVMPEPAPAGAMPKSGAYSPAPGFTRKTRTAQSSGGSCHDLSIPQEG